MLMFLFKSSIYRPSGTGVFNLTEGSFILQAFIQREPIFPDRGKSALFLCHMVSTPQTCQTYVM